MREQCRTARQPRLRYIFEAIERAKHTALTEDIEIRSTLTIEHIMPQKWQASWPLPGVGMVADAEGDPELAQHIRARSSAVNTLGNLTLLTGALNSTISNGPLSVKLPAIKAHAALALNRELNGIDVWDEVEIQKRGEALFEVARTIWSPLQRAEILGAGLAATADWGAIASGFPADGTRCRFIYSGKEYRGQIVGNAVIVDGLDGRHTNFSAASRAVTGTNRNGWNDWYVQPEGGDWVLADHWRKESSSSAI